MAGDQKTVHLDKKWMEDFLNEEVIPFRKELEALLDDEPGLGPGEMIPSMWKLIGGIVEPNTMEQKKPLAIGGMADGDKDTFAGGSLNTGLEESAKSIHEVVEDQIKLFKAVEENIRKVIDELLSTQKAQLEGIDGRKFLEEIEDVTDILQPNTNNNDES
ncbi:type VII secretion system-associated protein [Streptomyces sp. NPDC002870]|uniref:type VII secretion system-associated protein n=1 Tax=Streptomyces sp. NPDC002870 TaxID=3364666 RepID=UPI0036C02E08